MEPTVIDNGTFQALKQNKLYTDILKAIEKLTDEVKAQQSDPALTKVVERNNRAIAMFLNKLAEIPQVNDQPTLDAIATLQRTLSERGNKATQWNFDVEYNEAGRITGIKAQSITS